MKSLGKSDKIFKTWSGAIVLKYSSISVQNPILLGILNFFTITLLWFRDSPVAKSQKNQ